MVRTGAISSVFTPELARAGRSRSNLLDEVDLVLSWPTWETLRSQQGASVDRARKLVTELLTVMLTPYQAPPATSRRR